MNRILLPFRIILIAAITVIMACLGTVFIVIALNRSTALKWAGRMFAHGVLFVGGVRLKVAGRENIPDRPCIFVCNHESLFDIPAMFLAIDRGLFYIGKKELARVPFMGWYMWVIGMIFIDRSNKEKAKASLQKAARMIRNGKNVILYPEGTRTKTGEIGIFKRGFFNLSLESGVPIVPCGIYGARAVLPSGGWLIKPGTITVLIGKPIAPESYSNATESFANHTRGVVVSLQADAKLKAEASASN